MVDSNRTPTRNLQTLKMSKNKIKQQANLHHSQRSFEEGKIIWELEQIIETRTKQLRNEVLFSTLSGGRTYQL